MKTRIRLKVDLPIDPKYGCVRGKEYNVTKRHTERGSERTTKVEFLCETGDSVCALLAEFEWISEVR